MMIVHCPALLPTLLGPNWISFDEHNLKHLIYLFIYFLFVLFSWNYNNVPSLEPSWAWAYQFDCIGIWAVYLPFHVGQPITVLIGLGAFTIQSKIAPQASNMLSATKIISSFYLFIFLIFILLKIDEKYSQVWTN